MANCRQNATFGEEIFPQYPLDIAIEWIQNNLEPEDVFTEKQLSQWAKDAGYVEEC